MTFTITDYLKIYTVEGKSIIARMTMSGLAEKLPEHFLRVHRSYIVPMNRVKSVRNRVISLPGKEIPVGRTYWENFEKRFYG